MSVIAGESSREFPTGNPTDENNTREPENIPWMEYALQQAQIAQKTIESTVENAIETTRSRVDRILTTSSAHLNQTIIKIWKYGKRRGFKIDIGVEYEGNALTYEYGLKDDSLQDLKSDYSTYEDIAFGKIKEGFLLAYSHPLITTGAVVGVGVLGLKKTRQFLSYKTMRLFLSEETLLSRADTKVKELRQSIELLKGESETLEKRALQAEEDLVRGRTKLRQAGKQIQGVISSAYKIERQARGLKDALTELPSREASRFRTEVTNLAKEAKRERNALSKEVTKISNHGISV